MVVMAAGALVDWRVAGGLVRGLVVGVIACTALGLRFHDRGSRLLATPRETFDPTQSP